MRAHAKLREIKHAYIRSWTNTTGKSTKPGTRASYWIGLNLTGWAHAGARKTLRERGFLKQKRIFGTHVPTRRIYTILWWKPPGGRDEPVVLSRHMCRPRGSCVASDWIVAFFGRVPSAKTKEGTEADADDALHIQALQGLVTHA